VPGLFSFYAVTVAKRQEIPAINKGSGYRQNWRQMFQAQTPRSKLGYAINLAELIFNATVRHIRKSHGNAFIGLMMNISQAMLFVAVFYLMFSILGLRGAALRGDFLLYVMSGIFLFMTHTKAMGSVVGAEGPTAPMMQHAPMNTVVSITSAALSSLYIQLLSAFVILLIYYTVVGGFTIAKPVGAMAMFLLAWFSGVAIGMILLAAKPWAPGLVSLASIVYARANMIASGKMFVANTLTPQMLAMFSWNPLFHAIDQERGYVFVNYTPHNSSYQYVLYVSLVLIMIGLMGEFHTRKHASQSWGARS